MIQINCTIVNITSSPVLSLNNGHSYIAELESATRAIFKIANDSERGVIGNFLADGSVVFKNYTVPPPGANEGPVLILQPLVQPLSINRDQFLLPDGSNYNWRGNIDFMFYRRSLDGVDINPILSQRYSAGSRCIVTLMMAHYIEHFYPEDYGQRYYDHIQAFGIALRDRGFYWMPICFADAQNVMPDKSQQIQFLNQLGSRFAGQYWIMPSLSNEYQKNGCNPSIFSKPQGNLWSRGSSTSDAEPYRPGWDWKEWHARRDWPKVLFGNDDGWYVKEGVDSDYHHLDNPMPCISSEPIGFWDRDVPGRRSSDPNLARVIGDTARDFMRGGNFMSEEGLRCDMWTPRTYDCAVSFFTGINS